MSIIGRFLSLVGLGSKRRAPEGGETEQQYNLSELYQDLAKSAQEVDSVVAVRQILDRLMQVDSLIEVFTNGELSEAMIQGVEILRENYLFILECQQEIRGIEHLSQVEPLVRNFQQMKEGLKSRINQLLEEKASLLFYMYVLFHFYKFIINSKKEREAQVVETRAKIRAIEAYQATEDRVGVLIGEGSISPSLPNFRSLAREAVELRADLITKAVEMIVASNSILSVKNPKNPKEQLDALRQVLKEAPDIMILNEEIPDLMELKLPEGWSLEGLQGLQDDLLESLENLNVLLKDNIRQFSPQEIESRAAYFERVYNKMPKNRKTYKGKVRSWKEVWKAIGSKEHQEAFLQGCETLDIPIPYLINGHGQLVMGSGWNDPDTKTLGRNYFESRDAETRFARLINGKIRISKLELEPAKLPGATLFWSRGLIEFSEYMQVNQGQYEKHYSIWTEDGKSPYTVYCVGWNLKKKNMTFKSQYPEHCSEDTGSRPVLRVNLNL